jgi:glycine oxidase
MGTVACVGAGLPGRLLALELSVLGWQVSLFDCDDETGAASCSYAGAGMLAPFSEMELADEPVFALGKDSTKLWSEILSQLSVPVFMQGAGTIAIAHAHDAPLLDQFAGRIIRKLPPEDIDQGVKFLHSQQIQELEPSLAKRFNKAIYLPLEGQIDNRQLLIALAEELRERFVAWRSHTIVSHIRPYEITVESATYRFDLVIDCRGLGAREDIARLRGVRGELIDVHAPEVSLARPLRLMHPRYPLYIVPRQNKRFLIGATSIESDDDRPTTVQSALELLSAAFSVHPGFAEGSIMEMRVNLRPALPDNLPKIFHQRGLIRINGLYRHGFLLVPKLVKLITAFIESGRVDADWKLVFQEESLAYASNY